MKYRDVFGAAASLMLCAGIASAAPVSFTTFDSTNSDQLNPTVTISNDVAGEFLVTLVLPSPEFGNLVSVYFDIGGAPTNTDLATLSATSVSPVVPDPDLADDFTFQFLNGINAKTDDFCENNILSGGLALPTFEGSVCYRQTGSKKPDSSSPVSFKIVDIDSLLTLEDFDSLGLRYKSSSNDGGSDKLYGLVKKDAFGDGNEPEPVPLPAAGWLLIAGLGGLGVLRCRKRTA